VKKKTCPAARLVTSGWRKGHVDRTLLRIKRELWCRVSGVGSISVTPTPDPATLLPASIIASDSSPCTSADTRTRILLQAGSTIFLVLLRPVTACSYSCARQSGSGVRRNRVDSRARRGEVW